MCNFRDPSLATFYLCMYLIFNKEHFGPVIQTKFRRSLSESQSNLIQSGQPEQVGIPTMMKVKQTYVIDYKTFISFKYPTYNWNVVVQYCLKPCSKLDFV